MNLPSAITVALVCFIDSYRPLNLTDPTAPPCMTGFHPSLHFSRHRIRRYPVHGPHDGRVVHDVVRQPRRFPSQYRGTNR